MTGLGGVGGNAAQLSRNKNKLNCALWFAVKVMFKVFHNKSRNRAQILREIVKEIDWNIRMNRKLGSLGEILSLKEQICTSGGVAVGRR